MPCARSVAAVVAAVIACAPIPAFSRPHLIVAGPPSGSAEETDGAPVRTGKERLGEKWTDEQRLDDCKVPPDKRGTSLRPTSCTHSSAQR